VGRRGRLPNHDFAAMDKIWEKQMASQTAATHGVREGGGTYNLHPRIPAGGGNLALLLLEEGKRNVTIEPGDHVAAVFLGGVALGISLLWRGTSPVAFAGGFLVGLGLDAAMSIFCFAPSAESIALPSLLAGALSPLIMGVGFDLTGSYRVALRAFFAATLLAAVPMTRLGPYGYRASQPGEKDQIVHVQAEGRPCRI
jgi:hypothetical protein